MKQAPSMRRAPSARQPAAEQQAERDELFAGQEVIIDPTQIPLEDQSVEQLVNTAVRTHKDTTATAQRALKVVEESKQLQAETMKQLESQNRKMRNIEDKIDTMNEELTYAEKLLSYMRRCCCCWMCDSCTGADPEQRRKRDWERRVDKGETGKRVQKSASAARSAATNANAAAAAAKAAAAAGGATPQPPTRAGDPDIRLPDEHRLAELGLHEETRRQNDMIDQIHAGLEHLLDGAKAMNGELAAQTRELDALDAKAAATHGRMDDVNKNSQLKHMARSASKPRKDDSLGLPTKNAMAAAAAKRLAGV